MRRRGWVLGEKVALLRAAIVRTGVSVTVAAMAFSFLLSGAAGARPFADADDTGGPLDVRSVDIRPRFAGCKECRSGRKPVATRITIKTYDPWDPRFFGRPRDAYLLFQMSPEPTDVESDANRSRYGSEGFEENCPNSEAPECFGFFAEYDEQIGFYIAAYKGKGPQAPRNYRQHFLGRLRARHPNGRTLSFDIPAKIMPLRSGRYIWDAVTEIAYENPNGQSPRRILAFDYVPDRPRGVWGSWHYVRVTRRVVEYSYRSDEGRLLQGQVPSDLTGDPCASESKSCITFVTYDNPAASVDNFATFSVADEHDSTLGFGPPMMTVWQDADADDVYEKVATLCGRDSWGRPISIEAGLPVKVLVGEDVLGDRSSIPPHCTNATSGTVTATFGLTPRDAAPAA